MSFIDLGAFNVADALRLRPNMSGLDLTSCFGRVTATERGHTNQS